MESDPFAGPDVVRLGGHEVYSNAWMSLTEDEVRRRDGSTGLYAVVDSADFVLVIPFDGSRFHLVEQYRYPVQGRYWEFPQGSVAHPKGLSPDEMAAVELAEESGLAAERLVDLGFLHHGYGRSTNGFHTFFATGLTPVTVARETEEQDMRTGAFTPDELWALVDDGRMTDAASLAGLALLGHRRPPEAPLRSR
jgi:8-oxo-dGTP pyrophosphatase MutT (NUDIX family)